MIKFSINIHQRGLNETVLLDQIPCECSYNIIREHWYELM